MKGLGDRLAKSIYRLDDMPYKIADEAATSILHEYTDSLDSTFY